MSLKSVHLGIIVALFGAALPFPSFAEQPALPEPLTLDAALETASNPLHFDIALIDQRIREVDALVGVENADFGLSVDIKGRLRAVGPNDLADPDDDDDSAVSLLVSKPLYDFGKSDARLNALSIEKQVLMLEKEHVIEQRRILILEKYFDVLNADNDFISENEGLATGFIRYDRAIENQQLGLSSEIDVLRLQAEYELIRQRRYEAENRQRLSRMILAEAMGYPDQLPNTLEAPEINLDKPLSNNVDALIDRALAYSTTARSLAGKSKIAEFAIQQADTEGSPRLDFELEFSEYERESSTRDDWRASIYFDVPLYSGVRSSSRSLAKARYQKTLAEISGYRSQLRLEVLQLWQSIQQNRLIAEGNQVTQNYRDIYLDRSRAEYELEFKTDLGDAMVQFSRARTERLKAVYAYELSYMRLQALVGKAFLQSENNGDAQ